MFAFWFDCFSSGDLPCSLGCANCYLIDCYVVDCRLVLVLCLLFIVGVAFLLVVLACCSLYSHNSIDFVVGLVLPSTIKRLECLLVMCCLLTLCLLVTVILL